MRSFPEEPIPRSALVSVRTLPALDRSGAQLAAYNLNPVVFAGEGIAFSTGTAYPKPREHIFSAAEECAKQLDLVRRGFW
jgi:hypothetical protein